MRSFYNIGNTTHKKPVPPVLAESTDASYLHAVKMMSSWVSAIADQVRNPVAGLTAAANIIEKQMKAFRSNSKWEPEIVEEAVRLMHVRLARLDLYMMELAGFTRNVELSPRWIDLNAEWPAMQLFILRRSTGDVNIVTDFDSSGIKVFADLDKLRLILSAVIVNAVEACGSERIAAVCVRTRGKAEDVFGQEGTIIEVCDNGPGFTEAALMAGMNPFFTTKEAGTGLGLAMVEKYVHAHGGRVRISDCKECGDADFGGARVELFFPNPAEQKTQDS